MPSISIKLFRQISSAIYAYFGRQSARQYIGASNYHQLRLLERILPLFKGRAREMCRRLPFFLHIPHRESFDELLMHRTSHVMQSRHNTTISYRRRSHFHLWFWWFLRLIFTMLPRGSRILAMLHLSHKQSMKSTLRVIVVRKDEDRNNAIDFLSPLPRHIITPQSSHYKGLPISHTPTRLFRR